MQTRHDNVMLLAANHARHFDNFGFDYFTREVFDEYFPGYVSTTPNYIVCKQNDYPDNG